MDLENEEKFAQIESSLSLEQQRLEKLWDAYEQQEKDLNAALDRINFLEADIETKQTMITSNYFFRKNESDVVNDDGSVLIPLETIAQEGDYEKMDGDYSNEELEKTFSVISGSEFSRQVSFICEAGCLKEFKGKGDDEELMCPHCGSIGESPL